MSRAIRMTKRINIILIAVAALIALTQPARADPQLCSRMSYVVEAALAIEDKGATATRGWFRIVPGQCRTVMQGTPPGETLYVHARALPVYGGSPLPQAGHADFCVGTENFTLAATRSCNRSGQHIARFCAAAALQKFPGMTERISGVRHGPRIGR